MTTLTEPLAHDTVPTAAGPPRIVSVATAVPPDSYTQTELLDLFDIADPKVRSVFLNSAIDRRHLTLPPVGPDGVRVMDSQGELLAKHKRQGLEMGTVAIKKCLERASAGPSDIGYLACVTSTGFLTPGFSAYYIRELGLNRHTSRLDVVGMGCNAGLNGLNAVAGWARSHPDQLAVMVCVEICSAAYVFDGTMRTSVVNSLFGDGAAAVALMAGDHPGATSGPEILRFASCLIPDAIDAMRYDWDDHHGRFSFFLHPEVPYVVGAHVELVIDRLLDGTGLRRDDIRHWLVHSGGKKVVDSVMVNLRLTRHDVRHTTGVLRDYGNLSSGSFLFSCERLFEEGAPEPGDYGVLMTMGPGSTIETALARW